RVQRLWSELNHLRERMDPISELEAASVYETAIQQNPGDHRLYENQAEFRELTGDLAGAAADWEQVEKLLPHHFSGWYHRGRLLRRLGQAEESRRSLEKSLSLRPDLAEAHLELASLDITANRLDDALEECHTARKQRPNEARPLVLQADVLARLQRRDEALDSLREAIRVQPSDWEAHYLLGVEMAVEQKLPEAQALFAEAVRLKPGHVLSHLNLGIALAKQAKLNEALTQFQEVLRLDPVNQKALEAVKTIDALRMRAQPPRDTP
ncbi:MAG: tetratricopeptide repeat protein, partial [Verrucomicrobiae bacterium]|nr:tetratricopeptide repeat protein [Verrucomicrobiae bacterium]